MQLKMGVYGRGKAEAETETEAETMADKAKDGRSEKQQKMQRRHTWNILDNLPQVVVL